MQGTLSVLYAFEQAGQGRSLNCCLHPAYSDLPQAAEKLKRQVSQELGVPLLPPLPAKSAQQQEGEASAEGAAAVAGGGTGVAADLHPYNVSTCSGCVLL